MNSKKRPSGKIRVAANVLISLLFLVLIIIVLELIYRQSPKYWRPAYEFDSELLYRLKRNHKSVKDYAMEMVPDRKPITMEFNNNGFRADAFNPRFSKGKKRIMFIGDSYTAGLDYPGDEIFTNKIEENLKASGIAAEVLNASCPAWAFDQYYRYWITEGKNYTPDYLILMASPNDIRETFNKKIIQLNDHGELIHKKIDYPMKARLGWWLANRSSFYQYLQRKVFYTQYGNFFHVFKSYPLNYGKEDAENWDLPIFMKNPFKEVEESYDLAEKILLAFHQSCQQEGTQLILSTIPSTAEFDGSLDTTLYEAGKVARIIRGFAQRENIPYIDLYGALESSENPMRVFMHWEFHLNKEGHSFVAEEIAPWLKTYISNEVK